MLPMVKVKWPRGQEKMILLACEQKALQNDLSIRIQQ